MALNEVAPPGWGHTKAEKEKTKPDKPKSKIGGSAAAFKRALDDGRFKGLPGDKTKKEKTASMFKLMWSMKKKGDKPHYKPGTDKKYKKYQEEETQVIKQDWKKKNKKAMDHRYKTLHKSDPAGDVNETLISEKDLNAAERRALPDKDFVFPGKGEGPKGKQRGAYPIPDKKHARNALAMAAAHASPEKQAKVKAAVKKKFPDIQQEEYGEIKAKESQKFHAFYKKARDAKARKQADSTRSDSRKYGVKFGDAKGTGRIRGGKKIYD